MPCSVGHNGKIGRHRQDLPASVLHRLEAASLPDRVAVTNGSNATQRLLLRNAAVQLLDGYGNAASGLGVQVGPPSVVRWLACMSDAAPTQAATLAGHAGRHPGMHGSLMPAFAHHPWAQVRFRLRQQPGAAADGTSELPELSMPQAGGLLETDDRGRAFAGDLGLVEGSGAPGLIGRARAVGVLSVPPVQPAGATC